MPGNDKLNSKKGLLALFLAAALLVMGAFAGAAVAQEDEAIEAEEEDVAAEDLTVTVSGIDEVFSAFDEQNNTLVMVADVALSPEQQVSPEDRTEDALTQEDEDFLFEAAEDDEIDEQEQEEILNLISEQEELVPFPEGTNVTLGAATLLEMGMSENNEPTARMLLTFNNVDPALLEQAADVAAENGGEAEGEEDTLTAEDEAENEAEV